MQLPELSRLPGHLAIVACAVSSYPSTVLHTRTHPQTFLDVHTRVHTCPCTQAPSHTHTLPCAHGHTLRNAGTRKVFGLGLSGSWSALHSAGHGPPWLWPFRWILAGGAGGQVSPPTAWPAPQLRPGPWAPVTGQSLPSDLVLTCKAATAAPPSQVRETDSTRSCSATSQVSACPLSCRPALDG